MKSCLAISEKIGDEDLKSEALRHQLGATRIFRPGPEMLKYTPGRERYDRDRHHKFSHVFGGHDPGVCAHCIHAVALGLAGRPNSLRLALDAGLALTDSLQHPLTQAFFFSNACTSLYVVQDIEGCRESAELLSPVGRVRFPGDPSRRVVHAGRGASPAR